MIPEEQDTPTFTLGTLSWLNPLAHPGACPHGLQETDTATFDIAFIVFAHDLLDCLGCLVCVVEGDGADIVVGNVRFDDTVEDVASDEAKFTIDGGGSSAGEIPGFGFVVREAGVCVLEVGDGH